MIALNQHEQLMSENYALAEPSPDSKLYTSDIDQPGDYFITAQDLKTLIDDSSSDYVLLDVTRGAGNYQLDAVRLEEDYKQGHIPTAIHFSTDELGEFKDYLKPAEDLKNVFLSKGVKSSTKLILYSVYARDIMYIASRVAFAAYYLGVEDIKILDGGLQAWERAGYSLEEGQNAPRPAEDFGIEVPQASDVYIKTPDDLKEELDRHPDTVLVSIRSWNEFLAKNAGHAWNKGSGEVAGAVYGGDDLLTNELGEMADPKEYLDQWKEWGIQPNKRIVIYCGTSWRASTAFFLLKQLGWPQVKLYDGSWFKWNQAHQEDPAAYPIQMGDPRDSENFKIIKE